jgi:septal ring factor EnvC (AmiA/AmiB activator)
MKSQERKSFLSRLTGGSKRRRMDRVDADPSPGHAVTDTAGNDDMPVRMTGATLEQAYRELLLENQVLAESNQRLHERLAQQQDGNQDSAATRELVRAQRDALAERSHRLREVEYENKQLERKQRKLQEENQRLSATVARHMEQLHPLLQRDEQSRRELAEVRATLRQAEAELVALKDKYYQLEARTKLHPPTSTAANSDF